MTTPNLDRLFPWPPGHGPIEALALGRAMHVYLLVSVASGSRPH